MSLDRYLVQRGSRGIWQVRVPVPRDYHRRHGGPAEKIRSLRTADRDQAARKAIPIVAAWQAVWDAHEAPTPTPVVPIAEATPHELALRTYHGVYGRLEQLLRSRAGDEQSQDAFVEKAQSKARSLSRKFHQGDLTPWVAHANKVIDKVKLPIVPGTAEFDELVQSLAEASIEGYLVFGRRYGGELNAEPQSAKLKRAKAKIANAAAPGQKLTDLFERYGAQRSAEERKRADTLNQDRKVINLFAEFVGPTRAPRSITREDVRDFRDTVAALPPNYKKLSALRGLNPREAAQKARREQMPAMSKITMNKYLSTVSPFFQWMQTEGYVDTNPCSGLFFKLPKASNARPPFTTKQLNQILASPLFVGFEEDGKEHRPGQARARDWRYWIPLICLATGARIGEVAQLHVDDITCEEGVWCIQIRDDQATGRRTKSGRSRVAVVHRFLRDAGFLDFHQRQRKGAEKDGNRQMFPELEPNDRGQIGARPSRFWRDYLQRIGVKGDRDGVGAHSFRHLMADQLRTAGYLDEQIAIALGHSNHSVTAGYGRLSQGTVTMLRDMMDAVLFEGVDFTVLAPSSPRTTG